MGEKIKLRPSFLSVVTPSLLFLFLCQPLIATLTNDNTKGEFMSGLGD